MSKDTTITIFTPTYNRKNRLLRLKASLDQQSDFNFVWLIVDDGSQDGTQEMVREFVSNSRYPIEYYYQKNQGKHVAHNYAVSQCETELFFCVDSDDKLPVDAIQKIKEKWVEIKDKVQVSGIVGLKAYFDYEIIGSKYPDGIERATLCDLYSLHGKQGDTALVWRTEVIRQYPFKVFAGENFLRESTAYNIIDEQYKLAVTNEILYLVEYCEDGLSYNATEIEIRNPLGAAYYRYSKAKRAKNSYQKLGYFTGYVFYCQLANKGNEAKKNLGVVKYSICKILSKLMYVRYRMRGIKFD